MIAIRITFLILIVNIGLSSSALKGAEPTISECAAKGGECDESKGRPVCGTDNQTYPTRCHLIRAQCSGHQVSIKHRGSCKNECLASRNYALSHRSTTKFVPRCRPDGSYASTQCLENQNCWCVNSDGKPIPNTAVLNGKPICMRNSKSNTRRSSPQRIAKNKRGCSRSDKNQFNVNLVKMFQNEYLRYAKSQGNNGATSSVAEKKILDWKFTLLDRNNNHILDKVEFRALKRLVKKVVKPKRCARAFGRFCDSDLDERLSRQEWSNCFSKDGVNPGGDSNVVPGGISAPASSHNKPHRTQFPVVGGGLGFGNGAPSLSSSDTNHNHMSAEVDEDEEFGTDYDEFDEDQSEGQLQKHLKLIGSEHKKTKFLLQGKTTLDLNGDSDTLTRDGNEGESDCISDRNAALEEQKSGEVAMYVPECTSDGRYHRVQCYRSTGYCWCVHEDTGKNIPGTSKKDKKPQCDSVYSSSRPMKGCPENKKLDFLKELKIFLKNQLLAANGNIGVNTTKWGTEDEKIGTMSFVILDKNKNKVWERREWKPFREMVSPIKQLRKCGKKLPKYCDVNNDREITLAEWLNCLETQRLPITEVKSTTNHNFEEDRPVQSKFRGPNPLESYLKSD